MECLCPECMTPLVWPDGRTAACPACRATFNLLFLRSAGTAAPGAGRPAMAIQPQTPNSEGASMTQVDGRTEIRQPSR